MTPEQYVAADGTALGEAVVQGRVSPGELAELARHVGERWNRQLNAILEWLPACGAKPTTFDPVAPFAGVPFLLKDSGHGHAGVLEEEGSRASRGRRVEHDTVLGTRFKRAGFVALGRTNVPEFCGLATTEGIANGPCRNPWDLSRSAGGSSGGSAAAVAAGIVPVAHASDAAGSIRIPAAFCGLVGLKPSRGRVPNGNHASRFGLSGGYLAHFIVTRTVRDALRGLDALCGPVPGDYIPLARPTTPFASAASASRRLRVALGGPESFLGPVDDVCAAAAQAVADALGAAGHAVRRQSPWVRPKALAWASALLADVGFAQGALALEQAGEGWDLSLMEPYSQAQLARGVRATLGDVVRAQEVLNDTARACGRFFEDVDAWLIPTTPAPAPALGTIYPTAHGEDHARIEAEHWHWLAHLCVANASGAPAVSLPTHVSRDGLPIGVQLMAAPGREDVLAQLATELERLLPWHERRPST
jgi:amidase